MADDIECALELDSSMVATLFFFIAFSNCISNNKSN